MASPGWYHTDGLLDGQTVNYDYDSQKDGGRLVIIYEDGREKIIHNRNVCGILTHGHATDEEDTTQESTIGLVLASEEPTSESSKGKYHYKELRAVNLPYSFVDGHRISHFISSLSNSQLPESTPILYVIISIRSGSAGAQHYFDSVVENAFKSFGIPDTTYEVHTTTSEKSIEDLAQNVLLPHARCGHKQVILLLSGDGGVVDILNVLATSKRSKKYVKPVISLLPMGTGNALANSTGLNQDSTKGLSHFFRGTPHPLPTFTATFSPGCESLVDEGRRREPLLTNGSSTVVVYGAVVLSWALHASLVANSDTTEYRKYGSDRFQMAAKELLVPSDGSASHVYKGKITLTKGHWDGQTSQQVLDRQTHMYVLATLVSNLEEKLVISPDSWPLDGQIRIVHFGPVSSPDVMRIMGLAYQDGSHIEDPAVEYDSIDGMRIDFEEADERWRRVCVDGKIIQVGEGGWVEVQNSKEDVLDIMVDMKS